jgi:hypothetical protein
LEENGLMKKITASNRQEMMTAIEHAQDDLVPMTIALGNSNFEVSLNGASENEKMAYRKRLQRAKNGVKRSAMRLWS